LTGVYSRLQCDTYNFAKMKLDALGGDVYNVRGDGWRVREMSQGFIEPGMGGLISQIFTDSYRGISSCNFFLSNIERVSLDNTVKNRFIVEVRFLRALHYFTLSEFYGGVPIYTEPPTIDDSKIRQSTREEVVSQVIDDLNYAIEYLPNEAYAGHAVKGSA